MQLYTVWLERNCKLARAKTISKINEIWIKTKLKKGY